MSQKQMILPGPDHPITITEGGRLTVTVAGRQIVKTSRALILQESTYPAVLYVPREDVDMSLLQRSATETFCPYKGECSYFSIPIGGEKSIDAVWTYEAPFPAVSAIKDHLAFYADRVDSYSKEPG